MLLLCGFWSTLLLCLRVNAEDIALHRGAGEKVTLECSSAGCPSSIDGYIGMYLYHYFKEKDEVLYYHSTSYDKITPRQRYMNRTQIKGSLRNHTITISNLTLRDSGLYSCVYKKSANKEVKCNLYMLVVADVSTEEPLTKEKCPTLLLIIITCVAVGAVIATIFIMTAVSRVKYWISSRGTAQNAPADYVYEVMTQHVHDLRPCTPPQQST